MSITPTLETCRLWLKARRQFDAALDEFVDSGADEVAGFCWIPGREYAV